MLLLLFAAQDAPIMRIDPTPIVPRCEADGSSSEGDVMVCGRADRSPYRLQKINPLAPVPAIPHAVFRLSEHSDMAGKVESRELATGIFSNRATIHYTLRF